MIKKQTKAADTELRPETKQSEFADLCGVWTKEEARAFLVSISDFEVSEPEDRSPRTRD